MDIKTLIAQTLGIFAMALNILSYQQKKHSQAIACQLVGSLLFIFNYYLLGATMGTIMNAVGFIRAIVYLKRKTFHADHILWLLGFVVTYVTSYVLTFTVFGKEPTPANLLVEFLPVIGMTATTISFRLTDAKAIRRFGLVSAPEWLVYNFLSRSVGGTLCDLFGLCSICIGMVRLDRKKAAA